MEEELSSIGRLDSLLTFGFFYQLSTVDFSSVLPLQNKIRERGKGAGEFGVGVSAVEASFGAPGKVLRQRAGAIECAGFVNQRNDRFWTHRNKFLFREHARNEFARVA